MAFPNITTLQRFRRSYYLPLYRDFVQHIDDYALFLAANRPSDIFLMVFSSNELISPPTRTNTVRHVRVTTVAMENQQRVSFALLMHTSRCQQSNKYGKRWHGGTTILSHYCCVIYVAAKKVKRLRFRKNPLYQISHNPSSGSCADTRGQTYRKTWRNRRFLGLTRTRLKILSRPDDFLWPFYIK
jgi:hypothetical protein